MKKTVSFFFFIQGGDLRGVMAYNRLDTQVCGLSIQWNPEFLNFH